jgi:hypothetical protein
MASEPDSPKAGLIAWVTALSLVLIFVAFVSLQGLFNMWELRHDKRKGIGNIETPLSEYKREQEVKLVSLKDATTKTLEDAKAGKVLAAPPPPAAAPGKTTTPAPSK